MLKKISLLVLILMMASSLIVGATPTTLSHDHEILAIAVDSGQYVGNLNSHKFHGASCRYVGMMNPGNKVFFETREVVSRVLRTFVDGLPRWFQIASTSVSA